MYTYLETEESNQTFLFAARIGETDHFLFSRQALVNAEINDGVHSPFPLTKIP